MATYTVRAPDGSTITLQGPDGASQEEVIAKAKELYKGAPAQAEPQARPAPTSFVDYLFGGNQPLLEPFTRQAIRGAAVDPINAVRQLVSEEQRKLVAKEEAAYQTERARLGEDGYEYGRLVGNILSPAPLLAGQAAVRAVGGVGRVAQIRQAAGAGAAGAALQPVLESDVDFADEKIRQLGLGAALGGLLEGGIQSVTGGAKFISDLTRPMTEEGRKTLLRDFINKLAGPEKDQVISSLRNAEELVAGSRPTAAEAVAEIPSATGIAAFQRQLAADQQLGTAPLFAAREAEQEAARVAALGVDETAAPMMQLFRQAQTSPIREEALSQANIAGQMIPQLERQIAEREVTAQAAEKARQQFVSRGAEQEMFARQSFTPVPGFPRVSSAYRPNHERVAEAIDAAKDAKDIAAQKTAEAAFKRLQLQSLEDEGFYALKINPVVERIEKYLATPGERSEIAVKTFDKLRTKLAERASANGVIDSRDLYTIRKEIADDINAFAKETGTSDVQRLATLETNLKKVIDNSIEAAGGVKWKDYLQEYAKYSEKINRLEIGERLLNSLRAPLGDRERAGSFALAVENAAGTIKKATGAPRAQTLGGILTPDEIKAVNAVNADLQRAAKSGKLSTKAKMGGVEIDESAELPQLLNRTAAIGNFLLKAIKKNAVDDIQKQGAQLFLDPQQLAVFMQQPNSARAISAIFKKLPPDIQQFLERVVAVQTVGQPITPME